MGRPHQARPHATSAEILGQYGVGTPEDAILLPEIVDEIFLMAIHPARCD